MNSVICCVLLLASYASAADFDDDFTEIYGEPRVLDSLFNNTSGISMNAILAAFLIGLLTVLAFGPNLLGGLGGTGQGQAYGQYNQYSRGDDFASFKSDRKSLDELTSHMYQLAEAFKKYEVEDACQMYLSCEASLIEHKTHATAIPSIVNEIMRAMNKSGLESVRSKDPYVGQLLEAYVDGQNSKQCRRYRNRCYRKF